MPSDFSRATIDRHREAGTCHLCGGVVDASKGYHGATGAHWDCQKAFENESDQIFAKVGGLRPARKPRCPEGQGRTAKKALAMAVEALEKAVGTPIFDVNQWNQQGAHRGQRWDLDAWGLTFRMRVNGGVIQGSASSLATMTQCVAADHLCASPEDMSNTWSLHPRSKPAADTPG